MALTYSRVIRAMLEIGISFGHTASHSPSIDDEILNDWECLRSPRLDRNRVSVLEPAHVELTDRGAAVRTMRDAVYDEAAHAANTFATIGVEGDGVLSLSYQPFVHDVQH